jgi:hypothetical protein
VLMALF